jgi:TrmH family RNA methyltransferase
MERDNRTGYDITSIQNVRVREDRKLRDRRHRDRSGLMSIEGYGEFSLAWDSGLEIERLYLCRDLFRPGEESLETEVRARGVRPLFVSPVVMEKLSYREHPDGWFAVARQPVAKLSDLPVPDDGPALYLVAEDIEKPGNLGAILRSADAAGAAAVIVSDGRTDLANPNVVRASKGVNFSFPAVSCTNEEAWHWLSMSNIPVAIADPSDHTDIWKAELPDKLAVVLGAENEGVSGFWRERASIRLLIPMVGRVNSLNVAQAATIIMYEALRRRMEKIPD